MLRRRMLKLHNGLWALLLAVGIGFVVSYHYIPSMNAQYGTATPNPFWLFPIGWAIISLSIVLVLTGHIDWKAD